MKEKLAKLIDVKSIITILLVLALLVVVLGGFTVEEKLFNLFSNVVTMVITYFFTKPQKSADAKDGEKGAQT